ncbi:hypothetical protein [Nocardiopsis sp. YSL2]|uniref:hypothetical protein n=1 Tax=Nocardiopsis sp. YSL2 TaxID=2939492 RepID=UPI0026F42C08|nr:hypothetical protein [Nocardiopsis sp. YSL2]
MAHRMVQAPGEPPELFLEGGAGAALPMVAVDWSVLGGPFEEPGHEVDWSGAERRTTGPDVALEFGTEQIPTRVVVYSYAEVGESGVPDEESGTETMCSFEGDGADVCRYHGDGSESARVVIDPPSSAGYLVVHAAWPTEETGAGADVVSASWLVRPDM